MTSIVSFRPGVSKNRTAFEAQSDLYAYLQEEYGYEFTIVTAENDEFESDRLNVETVPNSAWKPVVPTLPVYPRRWAYRRYVDPYFEAADAVITLDPTAYPQGALALRRGERHDVPVWFDASATTNGDLDILQVLKRPWERRALDRSTGIIATVPKVVERYRERHLYNADVADMFTILGHPVDVDRFKPDVGSSESDTTRILTVSRLVPEKGIDYILSALTPLLREHDDLVFSLLGSGPMESYVEQTVERSGVGDSVELLGTVPHNKVPEVLGSADVFVNHPVSNAHWEEFFGVANLEAMASGIPTVVTDSGGVSYVIREEGVAIFVEERDVIGLRKAVSDLLDDPARRAELGSAARDYVKSHYATDALGEEFHHMIKEELGRSNS